MHVTGVEYNMAGLPRLHTNMYYHIWNRGVDRCDIFRTADNFRYFLLKYSHHVDPVAETYAYCLLPNHYHFIIRTYSEAEQEAIWQPCPGKETFRFQEPSQAIANLLNGYVRAFNKMHRRTGGLFEGRFGRRLLFSQWDLCNLVTYVHRNPEKHGLSPNFADWPYSSYLTLTDSDSPRIAGSQVKEWFGGRASYIAAHREELPRRS